MVGICTNSVGHLGNKYNSNRHENSQMHNKLHYKAPFHIRSRRYQQRIIPNVLFIQMYIVSRLSRWGAFENVITYKRCFCSVLFYITRSLRKYLGVYLQFTRADHFGKFVVNKKNKKKMDVQM